MTQIGVANLINANYDQNGKEEITLTYLPRIAVRLQSDGTYKASVRGNLARFGVGHSVAEAVGDLVITYGLSLGNEVTR